MKILTIITLVFVSNLGFAQVTIKGKIFNYYEEAPCIGVLVENGKNATLSGLHGEFILSVDKNQDVRFSDPDLIDLVFSTSNLPDTLECVVFMISINPYKECIADGIIEHLFWQETICDPYIRRMDRAWKKARKTDFHTPLNWRINSLNQGSFSITNNGLKFSYTMHYNKKLKDYRQYYEATEKDYFYCKIYK